MQGMGVKKKISLYEYMVVGKRWEPADLKKISVGTLKAEIISPLDLLTSEITVLTARHKCRIIEDKALDRVISTG